MTAFATPIAEQIWDMKYRFKTPEGEPVDATVEDSWRRVARALAAVEKVERIVATEHSLASWRK